MFQGDSSTNIQFDFKINTPTGTSLVESDRYEVTSNIGTLFSADWTNIKVQEVKMKMVHY